MSFLQLVLSLDKTKEGIILFWEICHLDIFTDARLTDITTEPSHNADWPGQNLFWVM